MGPNQLKNKSLLIGNGPNLLMDGRASWKNVLKQLADYASEPAVLKTSLGKPFPLLYEELAIRGVRRGLLESDLKKHVASFMEQMVPNHFHKRLMKLGFRHLLTTNYDYCLEKGSNKSDEIADLRTENRYNLYRRRSLKGTYIWHIHGEIGRPRTITLGYDHYVGYLGKVKDYLIFGDRKKRETSEDCSSFVLGDTNFEDSNRCYSWIDVFLRDDIHILGLSLEYSEIDLWWLLIYKERQRLKWVKQRNLKNIGSTTFYFFAEQAISGKAKAKLSLLESIGVETVAVPSDRGYERAYHDILDRIVNRRSSWRRLSST
jgi:hypothetical protein